jgi:hypothetical protein
MQPLPVFRAHAPAGRRVLNSFPYFRGFFNFNPTKSFFVAMKKVLLIPALLFAGAAQAQNHAVKVDIFQPIINTLAVSYEQKLSESSSFQVAVSGTFGYKDGSSSYSFNAYSDQLSTSGFSITPEYRLYLSEKHPALEGFYVAPYVRFQYLSQTGNLYNYSSSGSMFTQKYDANLTAFGLGVTVGRHWIFKQRFSLDLFAGPGYTFASTSSNQNGVSPSKGDFVGYINNNNYDLRGGVTFGIAF